MTSFSQKVRHGFSHAAPHYDDHASLQRQVLQNALLLCRPSNIHVARILDAGCGTGMLSRAHPEWDILQLDSAEGMVTEAGSGICADLCDLPLSDESIDIVFSSLCMQWVENPARAWREFGRILSAGGRTIVTTFLPGTLEELRQTSIDCGLGNRVNQFTDMFTLTRQMRDAGLTLISAREEIQTMWYDSPMALFKELHGLGASYRGDLPPLTKQQMATLADAYTKRFGTDRGVPASFHVMYLYTRKPL